MKKIITNEAQHHHQAVSIRQRELAEMSEQEPSAVAKRQMQHKPYQVMKRFK